MIESPIKPKTRSKRVNPKEYRKPMTVTEWQEFFSINERGIREPTYYSKCPRCGAYLECEYVRFCSHCGQRLAWKIPLVKKPR